MASVSFRFDPETSGYVQCPYEHLGFLQANDPVHWSDKLKCWIVTRRNDVVSMLASNKFSSVRNRVDRLPKDEADQLQALKQFYSDWLMYSDPPRHTLVRKTITRRLSKKLIERAVGTLQNEARNRVTTLKTEEFDVISEYGSGLVRSLVCRIVGVHPERQEEVGLLSEPVVKFLGMDKPDLSVGLHTQECATQLLQLLRQIRDRGASDSSTGILFKLGTEPTLDLKLQEHLLKAIANFLIDGHEPIVTALSNTLFLLGANSQRRGLIGRPSASELTAIIEEALRLEPPFQYVARVAIADVEVQGRHIVSGDRVMFMIGVANREPGSLPNAAIFDPSRKPNLHLSFGTGIHNCPGALLARSALHPLLNTLFESARQLSVNLDQPEWKTSIGYRALVRLLVRLEQ